MKRLQFLHLNINVYHIELTAVNVVARTTDTSSVHQQTWSAKNTCYSAALGFMQNSALFSTRFRTTVKFRSRWNSMASCKVIQELSPTL